MSVEQTVNETANETVNDDEAEFEPLKDFEQDYLIQKEFPFVIKKKSNNRVLKESDRGNGYIQVNLNGRPYQKHVIVAKQFLENDDPEHKTQVDHINHNRADNRLENLRFVSHSTNQRNRTSYNGIENEYVDDISDEAIVVEEYNGHQFNDYYFYENIFYFFNGIQYRKLHINTDKRNGSLFVYMRDVDGKQVNVFYTKFKKIHDLL